MAVSGTGQLLGVQRTIARLVLREVVVPLIVGGQLTLDDVEQLLSREVALALDVTGSQRSVLAMHIGRSESWLYQKLREAREAAEEGDDEEDSQGSTSFRADGVGNQFVLEVVLAFTQVHPDALSVPELRERLGLHEWEITDDELLKRLQLYVELGILRSVGQSQRSPRFVAINPCEVLDTRRSRTLKMAERLSWLASLARASLEGKGEFGGVAATLLPEAFERARERIREAIAKIMGEAVAETNLSDEPDSKHVSIRAIIAMGTVGGPHESSISGRRRRY